MIWEADLREHLFGLLRWCLQPAGLGSTRWLKVGSPRLYELVERIQGLKPVGGLESGVTTSAFHYKPVATYWMPVSWDCPETLDLAGDLAKPNVRRLGVITEEVADLAVGCLAGSMGYLWWSINGDDLNVPPWIVRSFPVPDFDEEAVARIRELCSDLRRLMDDNLMWNKNAGKWISNYDLSECRSVTRLLDFEYLKAINAEDLWPELETWYWSVMKATGDPTGVVKGPVPPVDQ